MQGTAVAGMKIDGIPGFPTMDGNGAREGNVARLSQMAMALGKATLLDCRNTGSILLLNPTRATRAVAAQQMGMRDDWLIRTTCAYSMQ